MVKVLKTFIVLLLLCSIGALWLGITLFGQREKLKARILNNEKYIAQIAEKLRYDKLDKEKLKDHLQMVDPLQKLASAADNTWIELQDTKKELEDTKLVLQETQDKLKATEQQLAAAREQINVLEETIAKKDEEIKTHLAKIDSLNEEKQSLMAEVQTFKDQVKAKETEIAELKDQIQSLEDEIAKLAPPVGEKPDIPEGSGGKIVLFDPDWNFVVLNIGREEGLRPNLELMVHRDDKLIGKVRVSTLEDHMSVADIIATYEVQSFQAGDQVIYVVL